jgi:hypothetical protein
MASVLPSSDLGKVEFFEQHTAAWATNALAIGLAAPQVTTLTAATAAARAAYNAQQVAREAAKAATANFHNLVRTMADLGGDAIKAIKLKAATGNDPNVYVLAQIPAPAGPTPPPALVPPTNLIADPNADGTITLSWKGSTAFRTFFSIWRRVGDDSAWTAIGSTAGKTFLDETVPSSPIPPSVTYAVRCQRDTELSAPSAFAEIVYGGGGVGFLTAGGTAGSIGLGDVSEAA